jgi:ATP-binding cassette subfamily F protein 3
MLKANKITIGYTHELFSDVSFLLGNREKVGLVGLNGCGKSTLMRIIAGEEHADSGSVELVNERLAYLPQEFDLPQEAFVGEFLEELVDGNLTEFYRVNRILGKLGMPDIDHFQYIGSLSEGQQMKLYLAKLLVSEPTILLLDEPTNHLDIYGIMWLEKFITLFDGICVIISHDREFLNNTVNWIYEIDQRKLTTFPGNYDDYIIGKQDLIAEQEKQFYLQEKKRAQLEKLIENTRKIADGKKRGKAVAAAKKRMAREITAKEIETYRATQVNQFTIAGSVYRTKKLLEIKELDFGYTKPLFNQANFQVFGNEKVWFLGANGIGKTTFIKLLTEQIKPLSGEILWGNNITWEYFSQNQTHLPMDQTVQEYFEQNTKVNYYQSFGVLERFLFPADLRNYKLGRLSPGQRARLSFAVFAQHDYDFLILDEPTNHLDIRTKEVIETALKGFGGAVLLVSHDRYFVESVGFDRAITIRDGKLVEVTQTEIDKLLN